MEEEVECVTVPVALALPLLLPPPTVRVPCIPSIRWLAIGQKNVYLPGFDRLTLSVAVAPGAMSAVSTSPDGVWTANAWVIVPLLRTVIVIVPVLATAGTAGVILNSVSVRLTCPPAPEAGAAGALLVLVAAAALLVAALEVLEDDEPQPAIRAATANGARSEILSMDSSLDGVLLF